MSGTRWTPEARAAALARIEARLLSGEPCNYSEMCVEYGRGNSKIPDPDLLVASVMERLRNAGIITSSRDRVSGRLIWTATTRARGPS